MLFFLSICPEIAKNNNQRNRFIFPFYALTYENRHSEEWMDVASYSQQCEALIQLVKKEGLAYFEQVEKLTLKEGVAFGKYVQELVPKLARLNDDELVDQYMQFMSRYLHDYGLGAVTFIYEHLLSEDLTNSLAKRYPGQVADIVANLLHSDYVSFMVEADRLLEAGKIEEYLQEFYFMDTSYDYALVMTLDQVIQKKSQHVQVESVPRVAEVEVELTEREKITADVLGISNGIHDMRKRTNLIGNYAMARFLDQLAERTALPIELLGRLLWYEYALPLWQTEEMQSRLEKRNAMTLVCIDTQPAYDEGILYHELESTEVITELKGIPAARGIAEGTARIIIGAADFAKLQPGDILLAEMTRPDFLPIMKKAAAIVTDEGGLTCHAAIVARELGIPCVVGTRNGTRVFQDDLRLKVDANRGIITKI